MLVTQSITIPTKALYTQKLIMPLADFNEIIIIQEVKCCVKKQILAMNVYIAMYFERLKSIACSVTNRQFKL